MAIKLNDVEQGHAKDSVQCDRNKGIAIHALLLSLLDRLGVAAMEGRKSTANGIGVNGDVSKAIHKARATHLANGHKETESSVRAFVSPVWQYGIAPFLKFDTKADEWTPDWEALEVDSKLWETGEKSVFKAKRKTKRNPPKAKPSPVEAFETWFTGLSPKVRDKWLKSAKGKAIVALLK